MSADGRPAAGAGRGKRRTGEDEAILRRVPDQSIAKPPPLLRRIPSALGVRANWEQLTRYAVVGVSGYVISVGTFALLFHVAGASSFVAAAGAFCCALSNNFCWNRLWTFRARDGHAGFQATRYVLTNCGAFILAYAVLKFLTGVAHVEPVVAQATALLVATPPNFVANRTWSFRI